MCWDVLALLYAIDIVASLRFLGLIPILASTLGAGDNSLLALLNILLLTDGVFGLSSSLLVNRANIFLFVAGAFLLGLNLTFLNVKGSFDFYCS